MGYKAGGHQQGLLDSANEVLYVDLDVHKDVDAGNIGCDVHWDQTGVAVVDQQVSAQRCSTEVIDATGAIGNVAHDEAVLHLRKAAAQWMVGSGVWQPMVYFRIEEQEGCFLLEGLLLEGCVQLTWTGSQ